MNKEELAQMVGAEVRMVALEAAVTLYQALGFRETEVPNYVVSAAKRFEEYLKTGE